jgi:hypothetical protein
MIHIQKSPLSSLDQNAFTGSHSSVSHRNTINQIGAQETGCPAHFPNGFSGGNFFPPLRTGCPIMSFDSIPNPFGQFDGGQSQLSGPKADTSRFIGVRRSDSPPRGSNLGASPFFLRSLINRTVDRQDQMSLGC